MALDILLRAVVHPWFPLFCGLQVLPPCRCSDLAAAVGVSAITKFVNCTFPGQGVCKLHLP